MNQAKKSTAAILLLSTTLLLLSCPSAHAFAPKTSLYKTSIPVHQYNTNTNVNTMQLPSSSKQQQQQQFGKIEHCTNHNMFSSSSRPNRTQMKMVAPSPTGAAAVMGVISGGLLGGALHAIAGPDHLAALLPKCCGQRWYRAGQIGAIWGMGHGISAGILGLTAFGLKNRIASMPAVKGLLVGASSVMEIAVGLSLIFIGLLGIKEAREWEDEIGVSPQSLSSAAKATGADTTGVKLSQKRAVIFNGILHGFSWDGAPSLAPALAVATWRGSFSFLLAYAVGTVGAMTITTTLIGEGTRRAGEVFNRPDIPQKLSMVSSFLAMGVGVFWCFLALK